MNDAIRITIPIKAEKPTITPMIPPTADRILKPTRKTIIPMIKPKNIKPNVANIKSLFFLSKKNILYSFTRNDSNLTI